MEISTNGEAMILAPAKETLKVTGKMFYLPNQGWNSMRIKQEIIHEFPQMKDRTGNFGYMMVVHRSFKEAKKALAKIESEGKSVPIFLFFLKFKENRKL